MSIPKMAHVFLKGPVTFSNAHHFRYPCKFALRFFPKSVGSLQTKGLPPILIRTSTVMFHSSQVHQIG